MGHRPLTRKRLRTRPGQGLVEFVLIAPLLLLLIFGLVEFARAWNIRHVVTDAAREGARKMAVYPGSNVNESRDSAIAAVSRTLSNNGINPATATITPSPTVIAGDPVSVSISYPYDFGIVKAFLKWTTAQGHVDIQSVFTMRKE